MATKRGRKKGDWGSIAYNVIAASSPKELVEARTAQQILEKIGLDAYLAALTPEQRREFAQRMEPAKR